MAKRILMQKEEKMSINKEFFEIQEEDCDYCNGYGFVKAKVVHKPDGREFNTDCPECHGSCKIRTQVIDEKTRGILKAIIDRFDKEKEEKDCTYCKGKGTYIKRFPSTREQLQSSRFEIKEEKCPMCNGSGKTYEYRQ